MLKSDILEIIGNGENSGVEFKRDDCRPEDLAKEVVAMANLRGGHILLGVEDDGAVSGIQRENLEEWIMDTVFGQKVHPLILPFYEEVMMDDEKRIAVISFTQGTSKPYVVRHKGREDPCIRVGSVSRRATREQQASLFAAGGILHTEMLPVSGASVDAIDLDRLIDYVGSVLEDPDVPYTRETWIQRLCGLGFMVEVPDSEPVCTIAGLVLFGHQPRRHLRQAGLRIMVFNGTEKEYTARLDEVLDGPMVGLWITESDGLRQYSSPGIIETFSQTFRPFVSDESDTINEEMRRDRIWHYPVNAIRETVINALAHRDWTRYTDIEISAYSNRMEVISPGALQNSMSVEKMRAGQRSPRNSLIVDVLRDFKYVDARGMGIRTKVIPLMERENGSAPVFEATDDYLKTTLFKATTE